MAWTLSTFFFMLTFSWGLVHMSQPVLLVIRVTFPKTTMQKKWHQLPAEVKVTADFDAAAVLPKDMSNKKENNL